MAQSLFRLKKKDRKRMRKMAATFLSLALKHADRFETIVHLIAATTTNAGLTVRAELDENKYPKGVKISDAKFAAINLHRHPFHGDWNYTISPMD